MKALVVGRFQPLHNGHRRMLEYVADRVDELVVGVGSANMPESRENPFSPQEREKMIRAVLYPRTDFTVEYIPDFGDNEKWGKHVIDTIEFDVVYTNAQNELSVFRNAGVAVKEIPFFDRDVYSAENVRDCILNGGDWKSLVPEGTWKVIEEIKGIGRIRKLESE